MLELHGLDSGHVLQRRPAGARHVTRLVTSSGRPFLSPPQAMVTAGSVTVALAPDGSAEVILSALAPGGPYRLTIADQDGGTVVRDFYVGDLWLLAGQSNMEGQGVMADAAEPHPLVRSFSMARVWEQARDPLHFLSESPDVIHHGGFPLGPEAALHAKRTAFKGVGVGVPFGRLAAEQTGVPQGLICTAHGGTSMTEWRPEGPLYASMMASLRAVGQPVAGVLWYQGCSDTNTPEAAQAYTQRTTAFVEAVRRDLAQPDLPWLVVQIATEVGRRDGVNDWHAVQDQQRQLPAVIDRLDVCASADLEHDDWIHLSARGFPILARRLVALARRLVWNEPGVRPAPQPRRVRWDPDSTSPALVVDCDHVEGGWSSAGLPLGFCLRDEAGLDRPIIYQVRFEGASIRLRLTDDDLVGVSLYHGIGAQPQINTVDARGLPLPVCGPLPIEGLPPYSPWFRRWSLGSLLPGSFETVTAMFPADACGWTDRVIEGWNVVNQHDEWAGQDVCRFGRTSFTVTEPTKFAVLAGGDGPLRVWLADQLVIDDPTPVRDLGTVRTSVEQTVEPGTHTLTVAMNNRGGESYGFYFRLRYC